MNLCIIQARLGSSRLKNKIYQKINGKKIIEIVYRRVCKSKKIDKVIIATTKNKLDDKLVKFFRKKKIDYFRGSEKNVLDRYYTAAIKFNPKTVIRITSDCPLISHDIIDEHIRLHEKENLDVTTNYLTKTFPIGISLSICKFGLLEYAWKNAVKIYDKEHVMPFIYKLKKIKIKKTKNKNFSSKKLPRLTLDYPEDLITIKNVFNSFYPKIYFSWKDVLKLYKKNKDLFLSNQNIS